MQTHSFQADFQRNIEQEIAQYPIMEYYFLEPKELVFQENVRYICETECTRFGKSWSCPPAVGSLEECRKKCNSYEQFLIFTTIAEVSDLSNIEETLKTKQNHEWITKKLNDWMVKNQIKTMVLSADSCSICGKCTYPKAPCRHPEQMYPCIESYGILVTSLAEKYHISFLQDATTITWFSMIFMNYEKEGGGKAF